MLRFLLLATISTCIFGARIVTNSWKIVGGAVAEDGAFPYQVSIHLNGNYICGGSILNKHWILTAAYCIYGRGAPRNFNVSVGSNELNPESLNFVYSVNRISYHGNYDPVLRINDIGLIHVKNPIKFNKKVQPIELADNSIGSEVDCVLSGWGSNIEGTFIPNELQFINLKTISAEKCKVVLSPSEVFNSQLCTLNEKGRAACTGAAGSPLVANGKQIGIVSLEKPCAKGYPDVYTRVSTFIRWIKGIIET